MSLFFYVFQYVLKKIISLIGLNWKEKLIAMQELVTTNLFAFQVQNVGRHLKKVHKIGSLPEESTQEVDEFAAIDVNLNYSIHLFFLFAFLTEKS